MINLSPSASADIAWFKQCLGNKTLVESLKNIKLVISDVDGTLTDASIYVDATGEGGRCFSIQDGFIVKHAMQQGLAISFMSGKSNVSTLERAKALGIPPEMCAVGLDSKPAAVQKIQQLCKVTPAQTLMFGDDYLDADVKRHDVIGLYACPANTIFYLQPLADLMVPRCGGDGALRLLVDLMLFVQGKHFAQDLIDRCLNI